MAAPVNGPLLGLGINDTPFSSQLGLTKDEGIVVGSTLLISILSDGSPTVVFPIFNAILNLCLIYLSISFL